HAQSPLASKAIGDVPEYEPADERAEAEDGDQPCRIAQRHSCPKRMRYHMNEGDKERERRQEAGHVEQPEDWIASELAKRIIKWLRRRCCSGSGGTPDPIRNREAQTGYSEADDDEGYPPTVAVDQPGRNKRHQERTERRARQGDARCNPAIAVEP